MQFVWQVQHIWPRVTVWVKNTPKQFIVIYDWSVDSWVRNIPGVVIDFFWQKVEALKMLSVGDTVEVDCDITVNSYNDKWYNNISWSSLLIKEYTKKEVEDDLPF